LFQIYRTSKGSSRLAYIEMNTVSRIKLSSIHRNGDIPDLFHDGSRIIAYEVENPGLRSRSLVVLREVSGTLLRLADFPFAELKDLDGDGKPELISRARPLGQFFALECREFRTMAAAAFQTRIYYFSKGKFERDARRFSDYISARISENERAISAQDPRSVIRYGDYLSRTLSVYFDLDEIGRGREGWKKFTSGFPVKENDPAPVRKCMKEMESKLRDELKIPSDW